MTWVAYRQEDRALFGAYDSREVALAKHPGATVFEIQPRRVPKVPVCPTCGRPRLPDDRQDAQEAAPING